MPAGSLTNYGPPISQVNQRVAAHLTAAAGVTTTGVSSADQTLVWAINPTDLDIEDPARVTTVNTITGAYQDNWGRGVGKIQLSGNTGWMRKEQNGMDGYEFCQSLKQLHRDYQALVEQNNPEDVSLTLLLPPGQLGTIGAATSAAGTLDVLAKLAQLLGASSAGAANTLAQKDIFAQFGYYRISSDNLQIRRSNSQPLLFLYTWQMTVIADLLSSNNVDPSPQFVLNGATGGSATGGAADNTPGATPSVSLAGTIGQAVGAAGSLVNSPDAQAGQAQPGAAAQNGAMLTLPLGLGAPQIATQAVGLTLASAPIASITAGLTQTLRAAYGLQQTQGLSQSDLLRADTYDGVATAADVAARYGVSTVLAQAVTQALNGITLPTGAAGQPTTLLGPSNILLGTTLLLARDKGLL